MSVMFLPLRLIPAQVQAVVLATALDLFFSREGDAARLAPLVEALEGRVFHVHVRDAGRDLYLGFSRGRPWVHASHCGEIDVRVESDTAGFARLCFGGEDPDELVFRRVLRLSGDSESMLRFKRLLAAADIDFERELRRAFGDYFGRRVAAAALALARVERRAERGAREALRGAARGLEVPDGERLQRWQAGVEEQARRAERLRARIERVERRLDGRGRE